LSKCVNATNNIESSALTSSRKLGLAGFEVTQVSIVVNGTDQEEDLGPAKSRDGVDGGNTVGDVSELEAGGDFARESVDFRENVTKDGKLGNTSVLEFGSAVLVEGILVNVRSQTEGIKVSGRRNNTDLVFIAHGESRAGALGGGRGKGGGRAGKEGSDSDLHG
jgi:hypothetical protein